MSFEVESCFEDVKIWQNGIHFFNWLKDYNHCGGKRKWPSQSSYFLSSFQGFRQQQVPLCSNCCSREESSSSHQWIVRSLIDWTSNFQFCFESNSQVHWFNLSFHIYRWSRKAVWFSQSNRSVTRSNQSLFY